MNNKRFDIYKYSTRFSLPNIKKDINKKQIDSTISNDVVEEWLDESEKNKRVQFSKNVTVVNKNNKSIKRHSLPINDPLTSNLLPILSTEKINNQSKKISILPTIITETTLYRSINNKRLSISSINSSPRSSLLLNPVIEQRNASSVISSIEPSPSAITSSISKIRLSLLEFNSSLSEFQRKNLEDIRQIVPDEFENLVPTLIKLGVIIIPKILFQDNFQEDQMTTKELIERHRVISLMKKDKEKIEYQHYLEHLYGSILPLNNIHHERQLLKQTLSFQGQLALLASCQDEIERELNRKIKSWKTIPMTSFRTNYSEYSYSTNRSSFIENSLRIRKKSIKTNSSIKSNTNLSLTIDQNSLEMLIPDQIDKEWKRKSTIYIIEQGMILLDKVRFLSSIPSSFNSQHTINDINKVNLVKEFKRWTFLWSILYKDE